MEWSNKSEYLNWNSEITNLEKKELIGKKISEYVKDGDVIGFGSGSTSYIAIQKINERIKNENLNITAIPTSYEIRLLCESMGIRTASIMGKKPDWSFDGADEVDPNGWLIKGRGAAMFKEKINISSSGKVFILVDDSKLVSKLCEKFPIPVEVYPEAVNFVKEQLYKLGAESCTLRLAVKKDGPVITENNNLILDTVFKDVDEDLEKKIKQIAGVIESGLFIGYDNIEVIK